MTICEKMFLLERDKKRKKRRSTVSIPSCECLFFKGCQLELVLLLLLHDYEHPSLSR